MESTADGFNAVLRSLTVRPATLKTGSLLLLAGMHKTDLANFGYTGMLIFHQPRMSLSLAMTGILVVYRVTLSSSLLYIFPLRKLKV